MGKAKKGNAVKQQQITQPQQLQKDSPMSTKAEILEQATHSALETAALIQEAENTKSDPKSERIGSESDTKSDKGEDVTMVDVVMYAPKLVWNKGIVPTWDFGKGMVLKAWDQVTGFFESEKKLATSLGAGRYFLDRIAKIGLKVLKMAAVVTLAYFLAEMALTYFGFELFSPTSLLIIGIIALVCVIAKSVMDQKKQGSEVKASVVGSHITEALTAA